MMKMIEKSQDKQYMTLLIFRSTLGKRCPKKPKIFAEVSYSIILYTSLFTIGLLEKNRSKRPSLEEVLNHPWFSDFKDIH